MDLNVLSTAQYRLRAKGGWAGGGGGEREGEREKEERDREREGGGGGGRTSFQSGRRKKQTQAVPRVKAVSGGRLSP